MTWNPADTGSPRHRPPRVPPRITHPPRRHPRGQVATARNAAGRVVAALAALAGTLARRVGRLSSRPSRRHAQHCRGDPDPHAAALSIDNAGLVLIGPYLPRLFDALGLLAGETFVDDHARERAMNLTQYAVDGVRDTAPESRLVLNKVLCGIDPAACVDRRVTLLAQERALVDDLLEAVIAHWSILGRTTAAGLRETFLQRRGRLERRPDGGWTLTVEPGSFDILIDRLPWGYAMQKLSRADRTGGAPCRLALRASPPREQDAAAALADHAQALARELAWVERVLAARRERHFGLRRPGNTLDIARLDPPDLAGDRSPYASLVRDGGLCLEERLVLLLALVPHLRPHLLDLLFVRNPNGDRGFSEFGGRKGIALTAASCPRWRRASFPRRGRRPARKDSGCAGCSRTSMCCTFAASLPRSTRPSPASRISAPRSGSAARPSTS